MSPSEDVARASGGLIGRRECGVVVAFSSMSWLVREVWRDNGGPKWLTAAIVVYAVTFVISVVDVVRHWRRSRDNVGYKTYRFVGGMTVTMGGVCVFEGCVRFWYPLAGGWLGDVVGGLLVIGIGAYILRGHWPFWDARAHDA
jgi:hypothetical protein